MKLKNESSLNGAEGTLGSWNDSAQRWAVMTNRPRIQVKSINMEPLRLTKTERLSAFLHASTQFHYHDDFVNRHVFDLIWKHTSTEYGDIEGLIETISSDEQQFDTIYQALVRS